MKLYAIVSQTDSDIAIESIYTSKKKRDERFEKISDTDYEDDGVLYYKSNATLNDKLNNVTARNTKSN